MIRPLRALLLSALALVVGCATDDAAQAPGPPLKPATGALGAVAGEPLRIEDVRTVEAALAAVDEGGRPSDVGAVLPPDWRRARALGAWVGATLLAREVASAGLNVDAAALERAALPFVLSADRHLSLSDSAERARIDAVARRLALRVVAGAALVEATRRAPQPSAGLQHFLAASPSATDAPTVTALLATLTHPDEARLRRAAPELGGRAREPTVRWREGEALAPGAVLERVWLTPERTPAGLKMPLFSAAPGTIIGPVRVPRGLVVARIEARHEAGERATPDDRAQQLLTEHARAALDRSLWSSAAVTLDDVGLTRWLSAADLGPRGDTGWLSPCAAGSDTSARCEALNRFLSRTPDASRFVAAPRETLLNACDEGDSDAFVALDDDRGLIGPRLSSLWSDRITCRDGSWPCERASLLAPLGSTPLASASRTLARLARRCAVWTPADCPLFAALLDELRAPREGGAPPMTSPGGPIAWALARGCERAADPISCHVSRRQRPSIEERALLCFHGQPRTIGRALRAAACQQLAATTADLEGQRLALTDACALGRPEACHQAAQAALAAGDVQMAVSRARRALQAPGGDEGGDAAASLRLIAADTGCRAQDDAACTELAELMLAASGDEGAGLLRAKGLLADACRTSGAACASAMRLALAPEAPDVALAVSMASAACRGGVTTACQTAEELGDMLARCPLDSHAPADCRALAALFLDEDATAATSANGRALLARGCRGGDPEACDHALRMTLTAGAGLRSAVELCQQPAAAKVATCRSVRELPTLEQACRAGELASCVGLGQRMLRWSTDNAADQEQAHTVLAEACAQGAEPACAALLGGKGSTREAGLRALCEHPQQARRERACAELAQHLRQDPTRPRAIDALPIAERACGSGQALACRVLGELWMSGEAGEWSIASARSAWEEGCRRGDAVSCDRARAWGATSSSAGTP